MGVGTSSSLTHFLKTKEERTSSHQEMRNNFHIQESKEPKRPKTNPPRKNHRKQRVNVCVCVCVRERERERERERRRRRRRKANKIGKKVLTKVFVWNWIWRTLQYPFSAPNKTTPLPQKKHHPPTQTKTKQAGNNNNNQQVQNSSSKQKNPMTNLCLSVCLSVCVFPNSYRKPWIQ